MKLQVNRKYVDGVGCTVKIVVDINRGDYPMAGVVDWSTCNCKNSRDSDPELEWFTREGISKIDHHKGRYDLRRPARRRR